MALMAGRKGFEPLTSVLETEMMPFHQRSLEAGVGFAHHDLLVMSQASFYCSIPHWKRNPESNRLSKPYESSGDPVFNSAIELLVTGAGNAPALPAYGTS